MRGNRLIGSRVLTAKLMCLASQTGCDALFLWEETFIDSPAQFATMGSNLRDSLLTSASLRLTFVLSNTSFSTVWLVLCEGTLCPKVCFCQGAGALSALK